MFALLQGSRHLCCHKAAGVSAATKLQAYVMQQSSRCMLPQGDVLWPIVSLVALLPLFHLIDFVLFRNNVPHRLSLSCRIFVGSRLNCFPGLWVDAGICRDAAFCAVIQPDPWFKFKFFLGHSPTLGASRHGRAVYGSRVVPVCMPTQISRDKKQNQSEPHYPPCCTKYCSRVVKNVTDEEQEITSKRVVRSSAGAYAIYPPFLGSFAYDTPRYGTGCPTPCKIIILGEKMIPQ